MELDFAQQWKILCIEVRLQWKLRVYLINFGFCSKTSTESLLLGKNDWQFFGESCIDDGHFQTLVFSTCYKEEFTCNNGECISLELVCDGVFHCKDIYSKNASSTYILLSNVCFTLATLTEKIKEAIEVIFGTHAIKKVYFQSSVWWCYCWMALSRTGQTRETAKLFCFRKVTTNTRHHILWIVTEILSKLHSTFP